MYYVYRHIRPDKNEPFYIGVGTIRRNHTERAYVKDRNAIWNSIANKNNGNYVVQILMEFEDREKCIEKEIELIALYGKICNGTGMLANLTDGGEGGSLGLTYTDERKAKNRLNGLKNAHHLHTPEAKAKNVKRLKENPPLKKGDKLPEWWCNSISKSVKGVRNNMFGKTGQKHPTANLLLNLETGVYCESVTEAAKMYGYVRGSLSNMVTGYRKNSSPFIKV